GAAEKGSKAVRRCVHRTYIPVAGDAGNDLSRAPGRKNGRIVRKTGRKNGDVLAKAGKLPYNGNNFRRM
ncbi:MAG TPA: hypothetical protein H9997_04410, partial [Candidatus Sellimonas avistercoris]|nr:hypothetical protein [Candidatus Sellimonas avistercoris]